MGMLLSQSNTRRSWNIISYARSWVRDKLFVKLFILGHSKAVRDISFNNTGAQFLSAAYDRYVKLWDTETGWLSEGNLRTSVKSHLDWFYYSCLLGECIGRFTNRKIPYCVKFNPDEVIITVVTVVFSE